MALSAAELGFDTKIRWAYFNMPTSAELTPATIDETGSVRSYVGVPLFGPYDVSVFTSISRAASLNTNIYGNMATYEIKLHLSIVDSITGKNQLSSVVMFTFGFIMKDYPGRVFDIQGNEINPKSWKIIKTKEQFDKERKAAAAAAAAAANAANTYSTSNGGLYYGGDSYGGVYYGDSGYGLSYGSSTSYTTATDYYVYDGAGNYLGMATYNSNGEIFSYPNGTSDNSGLTVKQLEDIVKKYKAES